MTARGQIQAALPKLHKMAPAGYFIAFRISSAKAMMRFETYSKAWQDYYANHSLALRDPVAAWGLSTTGSCRWSALPVPDPSGVLEKASLHGLHYGLALSVGELASRTIAGFSHADREFSDAEIRTIEAAIKRLHHVVEPRTRLTRMQVEALRCVAQGKRYAEAAASIGISESAFKARLTSARLRLDARTTTEALRRADDLNLL